MGESVETTLFKKKITSIKFVLKCPRFTLNKDQILNVFKLYQNSFYVFEI